MEFVKPTAELLGEDGNIFNLLAIARRALKKADYPEKAKEMNDRVFDCESYDKALDIISEYCDIS